MAQTRTCTSTAWATCRSRCPRGSALCSAAAAVSARPPLAQQRPSFRGAGCCAAAGCRSRPLPERGASGGRAVGAAAPASQHAAAPSFLFDFEQMLPRLMMLWWPSPPACGCGRREARHGWGPATTAAPSRSATRPPGLVYYASYAPHPDRPTPPTLPALVSSAPPCIAPHRTPLGCRAPGRAPELPAAAQRLVRRSVPPAACGPPAPPPPPPRFFLF